MRHIFLSFLFYSSLLSSIPFKPGETLRYNASFGGVSAANASLKVIGKEEFNDIMTFHVQFTARSKGLISYLFPINDKIDLWLSEDSLFTIKESSIIKEGSYEYSREMIFDHQSGSALLENDTLQIPKGTQSPYSLFYFCRNKDIASMTLDTLNTIQGKKITPLNILIEEDIEIIVPAGKFLCTKVTPVKSNRKKFKNKSQMAILFSNDKHQYPVKIWLTMKYGSLVLELDSIIN